MAGKDQAPGDKSLFLPPLGTQLSQHWSREMASPSLSEDSVVVVGGVFGVGGHLAVNNNRGIRPRL